MLHIRIAVLGRIELRMTRHHAVSLPRSCEGLVAMLSRAGTRGLDRFQVAQQLWPHGSERAARHNLSTALWRLKTADDKLARAFAPHGGDRIRFASNVRLITDAALFERMAQEFVECPTPHSSRHWHRARRAEALYEGDAFRDLDVEWADVERERLRTLYLDLLHHMAVNRLTEDAFEEAIRIGQKLVTLDPYREDIHRLLMRAHMASGNRAKAIHQYRMCEGEISQSLGTAPMPETVALYESLVALPDRRTAPSASQRRSELVAQARERVGEVVQINGRMKSMLAGLQALLNRVDAI